MTNSYQHLDQLRSFACSCDYVNAIEISKHLIDDPELKSDPVANIQLNLYHGIALSGLSRTKEALTVFNYTLTLANGSDRDLILRDQVCCFDLLYSYVIYVDAAIHTCVVHVSALPELMNVAETLAQEIGAEFWMDGVHVGRARIATAFGRVDEAISHYRKAIDLLNQADGLLDPVGVTRMFAQYLSRLERYDEALEIFDDLLKARRSILRSEVAILNTGAARCYLKKGRLDLAASHLKRARQSTGTAPSILTSIQIEEVELFIAQGDPDAATKSAILVQEAARIFKDPTVDHESLLCDIRVAKALGNLDEANALLEQATKLGTKLDRATEDDHYAGLCFKLAKELNLSNSV